MMKEQSKKNNDSLKKKQEKLSNSLRMNLIRRKKLKNLNAKKEVDK